MGRKNQGVEDGAAIARVRKIGALVIATGVFAGYFPVASGTFGTLVGVLIVWLCRDFPLGANVALAVGVGAAGIWAAGEANRIFGKADASYIVIDEIVGFMITMIGIPVTTYWLVWGFILFRIFDVVKPPPANYFDERVKSGWGVVMDDVVAGIYGNLLLHLMMRASL
jgi:phosphatidylglycerophosphatase A